MTTRARWAEELLACGETLPESLEARILARGEAARATLVELATDPAHRFDPATRTGYTAFHAIDLLRRLAPHEPTAKRLVESLVADPAGEEPGGVASVLAAMGDVAVPSLLAALPTALDPDAAGWIADALVESGVVSEEIFAALLAAFAVHPDALGSSLGAYGDPRAIPALARYVDGHLAGTSSSAQDEEGLIAAAEAIRDLGGELTEAQQEKLDLAIERQDEHLRARIPALEALVREGEAKLRASEALLARLRHPRPNDPCPCGSGRKFKKCHEGDDEFLARQSDEFEADA